MKILLIASKSQSEAVAQVMRQYGHSVVLVVPDDEGRAAIPPEGIECDMSFRVCNSNSSTVHQTGCIKPVPLNRTNHHISFSSNFPLPVILSLISSMMEHIHNCDKNPLCLKLAAEKPIST